MTLTLRSARDDHEDSHYWYHVSMLDSVLRYSTRGQFFRFSEHAEWWQRRITDPTQLMYIIENDGTPVGFVRWGIERESVPCCDPGMPCPHPEGDITTVGECSIAIADEFRGCGFAYEGLIASIKLVQAKWPDVTLVALVLPDNIASLRLFEKAGFKRVGTEERMGKQHVRYEL